jgi:hypothetical protein
MVALLMKNKGRITVKITYVTSAFILVNNMHLKGSPNGELNAISMSINYHDNSSFC